MPSIFVAHGAPFCFLADGKPISIGPGGPNGTVWIADVFADLRQWAQALPRPRAILMLSAHWEGKPVTIGAIQTVPLLYDFYGFPPEFYQVQYPAPGAPELAQQVHELLGKTEPIAEDPYRGLDHGAYVPLVAMYPEADIPVLQVSLPTMDAQKLFDMGRALSPLRDEGVLIVGSGFMTHNFREVDLRPTAVTPTWAKEFDAWAGEVMEGQQVDQLLDYRNRAPGVRIALPTHEHFVPAVVAMGAAMEKRGDVQFPLTGFVMGSITRRSVQFG